MIDVFVELVYDIISFHCLLISFVVVFARSGDGYTIYGRVKIPSTFLLFLILHVVIVLLILTFKINVKLW